MRRTFFYKLLPHKLANKLFLAICVIGIFLVVTLVITVSVISGKLLYENVQTQLNSQSNQAVNAFDQYMEILKNTTMTASRQLSVQRLFNETGVGYEDYITYRDSYSYIRNIHEFNNWVNVYFIVKDIQYIMSSNEKDITSNYVEKGLLESDWFKELETSESGIFIGSNFSSLSTKEKAFFYAYTVQNPYNWKNKGYIITTLDKDILQSLLKQTNVEKNGVMLVFDRQGELAYNSDNSVFNDEYMDNTFCSMLEGGNKYKSAGGEEYYYSSAKSHSTGWDFVIFSSTKDAKRQIFGFQLMVLLVAVITLSLLIIVARLISNVYTKPISKVIDFIHLTEQNEFAIQCDLELDGELEELVNSFNALIASVRQNQVLRKKAEIDALQKQVDPHFLFNTLESIKVLALQQDTKSVASMIEKLSYIFRYNTNRNNDMTTKISQEISLIRSYLDIQGVRFGKRLKVEYYIAAEVLPCRTLKFILQPIVENSISHSMEAMKSGFILKISCNIEGSDIVFEIKDNGVGIESDKLNRLKDYIAGCGTDQENGEFGIGLKNIAERILLLYGKGYGLSIDSILGKFTTVTLRIPKVREELDKD